MTDEERKNLEATANWEIIPKEDFYGIADKVIDDVKFAFAPSIVKLIGDKNEDEIFELLDFWYDELRNKFGLNMLRKQFAENIRNYIEIKKLHIPTEKVRVFNLTLITSQQLEWIKRWGDVDSPIMKKALKNTVLKDDIFKGDDMRLVDYIRYCLDIQKPSKMARYAVKIGIRDEDVNKILYEELKAIGIPVGSYGGWQKATRREQLKNL